MPISANDMNNRAFQVIPFQQNTLPVAVVGNHRRFVLLNNRVDTTDALLAGGLYGVSFTKNAAGTGFYLPYFQNQISSVELDAHPAIGGVQFFTTDNLSGCAIYIDRDTVTNNLIVYHANNVANSPPALLAGAVPTPLVVQVNNQPTMDGYHGAAQGDYPNALVNLAALYKPAYLAGVQAEINRKTGQDRAVTGYLAGTTVCGFYTGGVWRFHYQTWGFLDYTRPDKAPMRWINGKARVGGNDDIELFAPPARFY